MENKSAIFRPNILEREGELTKLDVLLLFL
jgi:hypothetical protein